MPTYVVENTTAPMPNPENLRKQAKQYLRWHRERHYPVAAIIRAVLPRFHHLDDPQILEAEFKLADAQELVARQMGFDTWLALTSGVNAMTSNPSSAAQQRAFFTSIAASVFVSDVDAACRYYTEKLGFDIDFAYGDPLFYAQVRKDHARITLRLVSSPVFLDNIREQEHLLSASITVDSAEQIKQLFLEYQTAGVCFHQTLRKEPWGARTFIVTDPDGNLILFAGPAD